jgi:hypothetical protein
VFWFLICVQFYYLSNYSLQTAASGLNSITADTSVVGAVSFLKISKGGDTECRHGKVNPKLVPSVSVSGLLSFWSYPVMELVTSALTLLSVHAVSVSLWSREHCSKWHYWVAWIASFLPFKIRSFFWNWLYYFFSLLNVVQNDIVDITLKEVSFY